MKDVILHAFNWKFSEIIENIDLIADNGFGAILLPPILYTDAKGTAWWQRYQPKDYRIIYSFLGNKREVEEIIRKAHKKDLKVFTDMVINHMAYERRDNGFDFPGKKELENYANNKSLFEENKLYGDLSKGLFQPQDFNRRGNIVDWSNKTEVIYHRLSDLPDLSENDWVLSQHKQVFQSLVEMGFDGFRLDAVKHISLKQLKNITDQYFMKDKFLFGEILTVSPEDEDLYLKPFLHNTHISAYDFMLFRTLREAFSIGGSLYKLAKPETEGKAIAWDRAVTFTCNHDLPLNDCFRNLILDKQDEHLANAYILGRDGGLPLVLSEHNESAHDFPEDMNRWANSFNRIDLKAMIKFHNLVHSTAMQTLYADENCLIYSRGDIGFVAINKSGNAKHLYFDSSNLSKGYYLDLLHAYNLKLENDRFLLFVPSRTAQMWLFNDAF